MRLSPGIAVLLIGCGSLAAQEQLAAPVQDILSALAKYQGDKKPAAQRIAFEFPEVVVNSYLSSALRSQPRPGVESLSAKFLPGNRVSLEARLDFDAIAMNLAKAPREQLKGTLPVNVEAKFQVTNGAVSLTVEKFLVDGKALPPPLAAEVLRLFAAMQPEKFDTSKPVPLPFGLRKLSTSAGAITGDTGS